MKKTPAKKAKDLSPKGAAVKGGSKSWQNDNITLVRGAKPTSKKKDLPARKTVTGGKRVV